MALFFFFFLCLRVNHDFVCERYVGAQVPRRATQHFEIKTFFNANNSIFSQLFLIITLIFYLLVLNICAVFVLVIYRMEQTLIVVLSLQAAEMLLLM